MGTVREFSTVWGECGGVGDPAGGRSLGRVGVLFKDGGALSLFAKEVYAGLCRALFSLGSILGVVTFAGAVKITFYDTMVLL